MECAISCKKHIEYSLFNDFMIDCGNKFYNKNIYYLFYIQLLKQIM